MLICDFKGLNKPEMVKRRPVIVVSPKMKDRAGLCTIVPLSTTPPRPIKGYHLKLRIDPMLPHPYDEEYHWVKADMIYTVGFRRLFLPHDGKDQDGKRIYDPRTVEPDDMQLIQRCVLISLGLDD